MHLFEKLLIFLSITLPVKAYGSFIDWASIEALIWGATMAAETPWDGTPTDQTIWMVRKHLPSKALREFEHLFEQKFLRRERLMTYAIEQSLVRGLRISKVLEFQNKLLSPKLKLIRQLMGEGLIVGSETSGKRIKLYNPTAEALLNGLKRIDAEKIEERLNVFFKARAASAGENPELDEQDLEDEFQFVGQSSFIYIEDIATGEVVGVARISRMIDFEHDPTRILHLFPNRFANYIKEKLKNASEAIRKQFSEEEAKKHMKNPEDDNYDTDILFALPMERNLKDKDSKFTFRFLRNLQLRGRTEHIFDLCSFVNNKTFQENFLKYGPRFRKLITNRRKIVEKVRCNLRDVVGFEEDEINRVVPELRHPLEDEALYKLFQGAPDPYFLRSLSGSKKAMEYAYDLKNLWIDFVHEFYHGLDPEGRMAQGKSHIREDLPIELGKYGFLKGTKTTRKLLANVNMVQLLVAALLHGASDIVFFDGSGTHKDPYSAYGHSPRIYTDENEIPESEFIQSTDIFLSPHMDQMPRDIYTTDVDSGLIYVFNKMGSKGIKILEEVKVALQHFPNVQKTVKP